ncbi:MAG: adenylyl-sulfate kinase [Nannocystaceae bacterium]
MSDSKNRNIQWQSGLVERSERAQLNGHPGMTLWLTGLSGSGKSTLARMLERRLHHAGIRAFVLDGDNVRHGLNSDLGFTAEDRRENIRRVGEVARLMTEAGQVCIAAFISPYADDRDRVRNIHPPGLFHEIHISCPLEHCETRDPKGLYAKARKGEIRNFTGIEAPYEAPTRPEVVLKTHLFEPQACLDQLLTYLQGHGVHSPATGDT